MSVVIPERLAVLGTIHLGKGSHSSYESGHCAMEVVAWLAGLGHTDAPECASPVLQTYVISLNDTWGDVDRQRLVPYLPRVVGTAGDSQDEARAYLALDWLIRTYTPAWLDLAGLTVEAQALRGLRRIVDRAAGAAAWAAAGAAARAAVRPTVETLQASALYLLEWMIDPSAVSA